MHPGKILILSIVVTIAVGALLLALPFARTESLNILDVIFTATSATTVCGLMTIPLQKFTTFGHVVIFALMQVGGLGLITMTLFFISLFVELGLSAQLMAGRLLDIERMKDVKRLLFFTFKLSLIVEAVGAFLIYFSLKDKYDTFEAIMLSIFHSVSAFCNAGITLFPDGMLGFADSPFMLLVTASLVLFGSLGFVPWYEIMKHLPFVKNRGKKVLSLHSKIVLSVSLGIIVTGFFLFWLLESNNTLAAQSIPLSIINAFFNAVCMRSAGFLTVRFAELQMATILAGMIFGFIGSSSGSTGSGIKTSTFAVLLFTTRAMIMGRQEVEIKGRRISRQSVLRASAIAFIAVSIILTSAFVMLITETNWSFLDIMFEAVAAFSSLGISSGITPFLSVLGKILLIITMIAGRVGTLTLALALVNVHEGKRDYTFPEGKVLLS